VQAGPNRGWLYAGNINYPYRNTYEPILGYGSVLGIGVIGFFVGDYWNAHYRHRPWYRDRDHWIHRHPTPIVTPDFPGQAGSAPMRRPSDSTSGPRDITSDQACNTHPSANRSTDSVMPLHREKTGMSDPRHSDTIEIAMIDRIMVITGKTIDDFPLKRS
jgi:hypothetical protein